MNTAFTFGANTARDLLKTAQTPSRAAFLGGVQRPPAAQVDPSVAAWGAAPPMGPPPAQSNAGYFDQIGGALSSASAKYLPGVSLDGFKKTLSSPTSWKFFGGDIPRGTPVGTTEWDAKNMVQRAGDSLGLPSGVARSFSETPLGKSVIETTDNITNQNVGLKRTLGLESAPKASPTVAPPKPLTASLQSYGTGLKDWAGKNPWLAGGLALGLGGLGAYGLYDLLRSRRRRNRQPYYDYDAREF